MTKEEALTRLATKYFSSHGPATLPDFVWWSGLSVSEAKHALEKELDRKGISAIRTFFGKENGNKEHELMSKTDLPIIAFKSPKEWVSWLDKNHAESNGIWLRLFKKNSGVASVTYAEALDEALCYGWIDGQLDTYDEKSWLRKFTPRRPKSVWSKRNIEHINRLIDAGKMKPAGLKEVEAAKADGRWESAYDSPGAMQVPEDFLKKLSKNRKAKAFFDTLNKANTYAIAWQLQTAKKPETREKRIKKFIQMLENGEKLHD